MTPTDWLMTAKVLMLVAAGGGFVWWQLRDLANEKKRTAKREAARREDKT